MTLPRTVMKRMVAKVRTAVGDFMLYEVWGLFVGLNGGSIM